MKICADMIYKVPKIFFKDNEYFDETTVCSVCKEIDCVCETKKCECKSLNASCAWPQYCPCENCLELIINCKCEIKIKKEK